MAAIEPAADATAPLPLSQRAIQRVGAPYLDGLNAEQRLAVETLDGPVLVLAGAGTGKTRVLTTRIGHILATGKARGSEILAVTFTNRAAHEMKERIGAVIGMAVEGMPWLGTFHAIGVRLLRRHCELVGLKNGFTILDTDDQIRLLKQLLEAEHLDAKRWPARQLASLIDGWKNRGLIPSKVPPGEGISFGEGKGVTLYAAYQHRLKELNCCDFGDLLLECLRLFQEHPDVLATYHQRFKFILVDEYQDTNVAQYLWLRLLAQGTRNICCVGDDDQSIYGWRGAEVENILRFEKEFPGAKVIRLEQNYRSTGHILAAASAIIAGNKGRLGKTLRTEDSMGEKVLVQGFWDDSEEARMIGQRLEELRKAGGNLNQAAILVRASFQMRAFEDRFVTMGLPYRVIGGPRFYERLEIKDATAYLELTVNPTNDLKFERIINTPKRGLADATMQVLHGHARARGLHLMQAAREIVETEELKPKARKSLRDLLAQFDSWRALIATMPHTQLAELVLDESGYTTMWQQDPNPQAHTRLENLKELIRFLGEFENLQGFLEHVSLVMDVEAGDDGERVSLMTLHGAKGLEFDTVFLPGWEEGLFPHQRALDESGLAGLEEERRLAHVGLTRARKFVAVSFTQNRRVHALFQSQMPSRFVDELPEKHVEVAAPRTGYSNGGSYAQSRFDEPAAGFTHQYETPGWKRAQAQFEQQANAFQRGAPPLRQQPKRHAPLIEGDLVASSARVSSTFQVGDQVRHDKFGAGTVTAIDGNKLTVDFADAGSKKVVETFVSPL